MPSSFSSPGFRTTRDPEFEGKVTTMNRVIVANAMLMLMLGATAWGAALQSTTGSAVSGSSAAGTTSVAKPTGEGPHRGIDTTSDTGRTGGIDTTSDTGRTGGIGTPLDTGRTLPTGASNLPLLAAIGLAALGGALALRSIAKRTS
jgi:hypothetical protein